MKLISALAAVFTIIDECLGLLERRNRLSPFLTIEMGALVLVFMMALEFSSLRAAWAAIVLVLVSSPLLLAPFSINLGFLAAPLLIVLTFQLSTRKYRLVSIALPITALFIIGFGHYAVLVLFALLLTSPLRPDPDPRLGELFMLVVLVFIATFASLDFSFSLDHPLPFGLVFIALGVFAAFRAISRGSRKLDPIIALALASAVLFFLSDPLASLMLTLCAGVLVAISLESIFRFFELSRLPFKRVVSFTTIVFFVLLTLAQSLLFVSVYERMDPGLASSLSSVEGGVVGIDEDLAPALMYFSDARAVALDAEEVEFFASSPFAIPIIERSDERFSRVLVRSVPPYASSECFVVEQKGVLVEVRIRCSLS